MGATVKITPRVAAQVARRLRLAASIRSSSMSRLVNDALDEMLPSLDEIRMQLAAPADSRIGDGRRHRRGQSRAGPGDGGAGRPGGLRRPWREGQAMAAVASDHARRWEPFGVTESDFAAVPERDGVRVVNVKLGSAGPGEPGGRWLGAAAGVLAVLAAGAAAVSWEAQYAMVWACQAGAWVAAVEAGIPDAGALVFAALGVALALHGKRALRPRALNAGVQRDLAVPERAGGRARVEGPGDLGDACRGVRAGLGHADRRGAGLGAGPAARRRPGAGRGRADPAGPGGRAGAVAAAADAGAPGRR